MVEYKFITEQRYFGFLQASVCLLNRVNFIKVLALVDLMLL